MKIKIVADSTCDLSPELIKENDIRIIPMYVNFGDESFRDGIDITPAEMLDRIDRDGVISKTSAVPIGIYSEEFSKMKSEADAVIYYSISSEFSSSCQNAVVAAGELENVYVVDTRNLSTGEAFMILKACEMAKNGASPEEIIKETTEMTKKVDASFVIDKLDNLRKGGRCSALAHLGANLLQIKPCIEVKDGSMSVGKNYRGKYSAVLEKYAYDRLSDVEVCEDFAFVTYSESDENYADIVYNAAEKTGKFKKIYRTKAGCTVSTHCGRNTVGILFMRK